MNINKRTVKMLDRAGRKVTVRESRLQVYLDLKWTVGWPEDEAAKNEQPNTESEPEITEQPNAEPESETAEEFAVEPKSETAEEAVVEPE